MPVPLGGLANSQQNLFINNLLHSCAHHLGNFGRRIARLAMTKSSSQSPRAALRPGTFTQAPVLPRPRLLKDTPWQIALGKAIEILRVSFGDCEHFGSAKLSTLPDPGAFWKLTPSMSRRRLSICWICSSTISCSSTRHTKTLNLQIPVIWAVYQTIFYLNHSIHIIFILCRSAAKRILHQNQNDRRTLAASLDASQVPTR